MELNATVEGFWWIVLGIGVAVVLVVAVVLLLILASVRRIERAAEDIWTAGKAIAGNTVQIWQLGQTNKVAKEILGVANDIAAGAGSIDARLAKLPDALRR